MKFFNNSWDDVLKDEFQKEYFKTLIEKVDDEYTNFTCYPPREKVFSALKLVPFDKVRVVILGQDPYHGEGQAHGVSFSVMPGIPLPPSLKNIYKELHDDCGCKISDTGYLVPWLKQGVLMLNSVLSVRANQPASHQKLGWQQFTDEVVRKLNYSDHSIVFLLWGNYAISKRSLIDESKHVVFTAPHPSPFSAYAGFFGCKHFSKTNDFLEKMGDKPIDWQL